ncbi:MAG: 4-(cytidine 5'-diphospho)-2-C-methyl-D-erythritol kinase [Phycisphaerae bacterium]|nr:4-(cytidine 5'-diphospho)-2-C-methyl-D-erythritol kinase [Phycisphaerae bacterium]
MADPDRTLSVLPARRRMETPADGAMRLHAPAKINLDLHVAPRGADGFHPIDSLVAKVTLYDEIALTPRDDGRMTLAVDGADCGPDERNLAYRAAARLQARADAAGGADIRLTKRIPPGSGLGGGSSDAAAVLEGLNALWTLGLSRAALAELGSALGSDVPLFLGGPASRITGRGERVEPIALGEFLVILILPSLQCATGEVYRAFDDAPRATTRAVAPATLAETRPSQWRGTLSNDLAPAAEGVCPELERLRTALSARVGRPVHVSGSGAALFVLCDDANEARTVLDALPDDIAARSRLVRRNPW